MRADRAFTLLEVLIAVLVLALGLIGLAALLPAVIVQQRNASDATRGVTAAAAAEGMLRTRPDFNWSNSEAVWDYWLDDNTWSPGDGRRSDAFLWEEWRPNELDVTTGNIMIGQPPTASVLPVALRLFPEGAPTPTYVWDFAARRVFVDPRLGPPTQLQLAVFVRRVDQGIRVARGKTLRDVLIGNVPPLERRVPLGVDGSGLPLRNGMGQYGAPLTMRATFTDASRDRIVVMSPNESDVMLLSQVGQKLVDNQGNVYTVRGLAEGDPRRRTVLIDPPVPTTLLDPGQVRRGYEHLTLRQVVFVPHIPAAVRVVTIGKAVR